MASVDITQGIKALHQANVHLNHAQVELELALELADSGSFENPLKFFEGEVPKELEHNIDVMNMLYEKIKKNGIVALKLVEENNGKN